jgi:hypothetical protein
VKWAYRFTGNHDAIGLYSSETSNKMSTHFWAADGAYALRLRLQWRDCGPIKAIRYSEPSLCRTENCPLESIFTCLSETIPTLWFTSDPTVLFESKNSKRLFPLRIFHFYSFLEPLYLVSSRFIPLSSRSQIHHLDHLRTGLHAYFILLQVFKIISKSPYSYILKALGGVKFLKYYDAGYGLHSNFMTWIDETPTFHCYISV